MEINYYYLKNGDVIQTNDEYLHAETNVWTKNSHIQHILNKGEEYNNECFQPHRRIIEEPPFIPTCSMKNLEGHIGLFLEELKGYREEYKDLKHQEGDKECEAIFRGKFEAYTFVVDKLEGILKYHKKST